MSQEIVWIIEDNTYAFLIHHGAFFSIVTRTGEVGDVELIENTDFEFWKERVIDYEDESDDG